MPDNPARYTSHEAVDLGRRVPVLAVPSDVVPCALSLLDTLREVWRMVGACWASGRAGTVQVTIHVPARRAPLAAEVRELHASPAVRVSEKVLTPAPKQA